MRGKYERSMKAQYMKEDRRTENMEQQKIDQRDSINNNEREMHAD